MFITLLLIYRNISPNLDIIQKIIWVIELVENRPTKSLSFVSCLPGCWSSNKKIKCLNLCIRYTWLGEEWWYMSIILVLWRQSQPDLCEFNASLVYEVDWRTAKAVTQRHQQKKKDNHGRILDSLFKLLNRIYSRNPWLAIFW